MTQEQHIDYWLESAAHDLETAETLFQTAHYDWCLFVGHLIIEKILKAHYVKELNKIPPKSHDLVKLSEYLKLDIDEEIMEKSIMDTTLLAPYLLFNSSFHSKIFSFWVDIQDN
jgi:HEPN domain-containing protein